MQETWHTRQYRDSRFDTWSEWVDYCASDRVRQSNFSREHGCSFTKTYSFEEAVKLAHDGWADGATDIEKFSGPLFDRVSQLVERASVVYDVEGIGIDTARYLDGEPECWQKWETTVIEGFGSRVIRLAFNFATSSGISTEVITAKGAAVAALVQLLEYSGYSVEVSAVEGAETSGYRDECRVIVKQADQFLDMPRLAFALAHPAMLRRLWFSYVEMQPAYFRNAVEQGSGYGLPVELKDKSTYDIYVPKTLWTEPQWKIPESATKWILDNLKAQGVTLRELDN